MKINKLQEALEIFRQYGNVQVYANDSDIIVELDPADVEPDDHAKLSELGFVMGADGQSYEG